VNKTPRIIPIPKALIYLCYNFENEKGHGSNPTRSPVFGYLRYPKIRGVKIYI